MELPGAKLYYRELCKEKLPPRPERLYKFEHKEMPEDFKVMKVKKAEELKREKEKNREFKQYELE